MCGVPSIDTQLTYCSPRSCNKVNIKKYVPSMFEMIFVCRWYICIVNRRKGLRLFLLLFSKSSILIITHYSLVCALQVFCIFLFMCAASLFGTIVAQVNEIVGELTTKKKDLDKILEAYLVLNPRYCKTQCTNAQKSCHISIIACYNSSIRRIADFLISWVYFRLDMPTIFQVRKWERFRFLIDFEAQQVWAEYLQI